MTISDNKTNFIDSKMARFHEQIKIGASADEVWLALQNLYQATVGCILFTVTIADMKKMEARRVYTSHPVEYPVSGTKPIHMDEWFDIVHTQQKLFVANTISEIAKVFPDHAKIWAMGCGSVVNVPVIIDRELVATINILDVEHHYTQERIETIEQHLSSPSLQTYEHVHRTN